MPAMKPGSGGPYSELQWLRYEKKSLKQKLEYAPLGKRKRKNLKRELKNIQDRLVAANAVVRELRKSKTA
jgi:hypothetical protein